MSFAERSLFGFAAVVPAGLVPMNMDLPEYQLLRDAQGWELSGGSLKKELHYPDDGESIDTAKRIVGFLAQVTARSWQSTAPPRQV